MVVAAGFSRFSCSLLLLLLLALSFSESMGGNLNPSDCNPRCSYRCSGTSHKKPCMSFCMQCCAQCLCVPPGTYGNRQVCACYNNWKTKRGGPKCP
ncbi:protein RSI-1-like [Ananas comosus]|uniref:Protein RSI-1 n=1 Tax=Ananas comosus TaxID=4615 RepID=A0A199V778_ANACO|nr:protein RSI-1-like [Ananas comosus]OAY72685.1 Protein RSI-1 [Ananas comosus]